jgi:hypothetical protein
MDEWMTFGELMHGDFVIVNEEADDSAQQELDRTGKPIAVVVDDAGEVSGVWSVEGRRNAIVASSGTSAADIISSPFLRGELIRTGAHIVVVSDAGPVGVVPAPRYAQYLAFERGLPFSSLSEAAVGDSGMPGDPVLSRLVIYCKVCGTRNLLESFVEGRTLCANPKPSLHALVRR